MTERQGLDLLTASFPATDCGVDDDGGALSHR